MTSGLLTQSARFVPAQVPKCARSRYGSINVPIAWGGVSGVGTGIISGMLGVGGGVVMVPTMTLLMHVPVKAAVGTSSFMVGITSVATAFVYYSRGKIDPSLVVPAIIGVFLGEQVGSRLTRRVRAQRLSVIFAVILLYLGVSLLLRAVGIKVPGQS